jgi:ADP-ribose pyrophosphatase YjhB (NUDIX family)
MPDPIDGLEERDAVRIVLLDRDDRILLFLGTTEDGARLWFTPGGGVDPGEDVDEALRRELTEEIGPVGVEVGSEVWFRKHAFRFLGQLIRQRERYFLGRVDAFELGAEVSEEHRRERIDGYRWWPLDELERCPDLTAPRRLAALLRMILEEGPPIEPFDAGV